MDLVGSRKIKNFFVFVCTKKLLNWIKLNQSTMAIIHGKLSRKVHIKWIIKEHKFPFSHFLTSSKKLQLVLARFSSITWAGTLHSFKLFSRSIIVGADENIDFSLTFFSNTTVIGTIRTQSDSHHLLYLHKWRDH